MEMQYMTSSLDKETVRRMIDEFYRAAEQPGWSGEVNEGLVAISSG
jgi:hypothetical protein